MKIIVDIKDDKVPFMMEVLKNFKFVKSVNLSSYKEDVLDGIKQGVQEMKQMRSSKIKPVEAEELNLTKKEKKILKNIEQGVEEINLIKEGKLKGIPVEELFDEL